MARSAAAQPGKPSLGARVLVAEDDEGLGEVLARGLPEHGYVVGLVSDGETAAAYFRHYTYQVAVVDWLMPRQRMNWPGSACKLGAVRRQRLVLLIAGGIGITPLRALFETLPARPGDLTLIYRASDDSELIFRRELEHLARQRRARLWLLTGSRIDLGGDPLTPAALAAHVPGLTRHDVYLCGPDGMTADVARSLRAAGVPRRQIHHESFTF